MEEKNVVNTGLMHLKKQIRVNLEYRRKWRVTWTKYWSSTLAKIRINKTKFMWNVFERLKSKNTWLKGNFWLDLQMELKGILLFYSIKLGLTMVFLKDLQLNLFRRCWTDLSNGIYNRLKKKKRLFIAQLVLDVPVLP